MRHSLAASQKTICIRIRVRTLEKAVVVTVIEPDGNVKSVHVKDTKKATLQAIAKPIVDQSANIMTDANVSYHGLDEHFRSHQAVDHRCSCGA